MANNMDLPPIHSHAASIGLKDCFNVINSYNNTHADEPRQVLEWLSPLEPRVRHQDVRTNRVDGVGEWLPRSEDFINWRDGTGGSDRAVLFCSGAPGVGKTYLSSLVIDALCDRIVEKKMAVACFYCDFQDQKNQTPEAILGALVKQLVRGSGAIPSEIDNAFRRAMGQVGGRGLRVHELLPLLQAAVAPLERAFICIDALDECLEKHLPELLRSLHTVSQRSPKIRLFITARLHIDREIKKYFPGGALFVQIKPTMEDIMKYLEMMLDNDPEPEAMNAGLKAEIVKRVLETVSDVFLLVSLNITAILAEATIYDRQEQLKRMTNGVGLGDAYRVALGRMAAQGGARSRLGMAALMWISRSERPMTMDELCHALGVRIGSTDLNSQTIPSLQTLLASCLGLIAVDNTGSTVRLVHFTLQEYLDSHSEIFPNPYATMAEICLTYLNYDCVNDLSPSLYPAPSATPFLEYASTYWGPYARNEITESVKLLALRLLMNFDSHISAKLLLRPHVFQLFIQPGTQPTGFTGLHCVAYLGVDEIASALLEIRDGDINRKAFLGRTPLVWAAENGREGIITQFLKHKDINCEARESQWGLTALSYAAKGEYEGIVKLLLDQAEVNAESEDMRGRTPLSYAAVSGNERVVGLLLEREEVKTQAKDFQGRTPLARAAMYGKEGVVKLFLEREEVNAESRDSRGRTLLSLAAESGNEGVVRLFLERKEVNTESKDNEGKTPLSHATRSKNEGVVKLFLERKEVNAESRDNQCRTPLSHAAEFGNEGVVKLFLEQEEVNAESKDDEGRTPLSHAARGYRNEGVVGLLLERKEVKAESKDNRDRTPLSHAAELGNEGVVKLFLERKEVNAESKDIQGRTPLSHAARSGNEGVVKLFLERKEVNAESKDNEGRTPLSHATRWYGNEEVVKLLLERKEVKAESKDSKGRTPLSHAAECGNHGVVKLLLERKEVKAESRDDCGRTPLSHATCLRNQEVINVEDSRLTLVN